jgi:hypothetical protein
MNELKKMLNGAPGEIVKDTKKNNFCIEKSKFYILKRMIAQVSMIYYYIRFLN